MHPKKGRSKTSLIKAKKLVFELESLDLSLIFQLWKVGLVKRFQKRDRHQKTLLRCLNPTYNTQNAPFSWKLDKTKWSITIRRQRENRNWKMNEWYQVLLTLKHVSVILLIYFNVFSLDFGKYCCIEAPILSEIKLL